MFFLCVFFPRSSDCSHLKKKRGWVLTGTLWFFFCFCTILLIFNISQQYNSSVLTCTKFIIYGLQQSVDNKQKQKQKKGRSFCFQLNTLITLILYYYGIIFIEVLRITSMSSYCRHCRCRCCCCCFCLSSPMIRESFLLLWQCNAYVPSQFRLYQIHIPILLVPLLPLPSYNLVIFQCSFIVWLCFFFPSSYSYCWRSVQCMMIEPWKTVTHIYIYIYSCAPPPPHCIEKGKKSYSFRAENSIQTIFNGSYYYSLLFILGLCCYTQSFVIGAFVYAKELLVLLFLLLSCCFVKCCCDLLLFLTIFVF